MNEHGIAVADRCVRAGVICRNCGYDLRGWRDDVQCPECGFEIAYSLAPLRTAIQSGPVVAKAIRGLSFTVVSVLLGIVSFPVGGWLSDCGYPLIACLSSVSVAAAMRLFALRTLVHLHDHALAVMTHKNEIVSSSWPLMADVALGVAILVAAAVDQFRLVAYGVPFAVVFGTVILAEYVRRAGVALFSIEVACGSRVSLLFLLAGSIGLAAVVVAIELDVLADVAVLILLVVMPVAVLAGFAGVVRTCSLLRADLLSMRRFAGEHGDPGCT